VSLIDVYDISIIPPDAEAAIDIRIAPTVDLPQFYAMIEDWCADVTLSYQQKTNSNVITPTEESNPWWVAFKGACDSVYVPGAPSSVCCY